MSVLFSSSESCFVCFIKILIILTYKDLTDSELFFFFFGVSDNTMVLFHKNIIIAVYLCYWCWHVFSSCLVSAYVSV